MPASVEFHRLLIEMLDKRSPMEAKDFLDPLVEQGLVDFTQPLPSSRQRGLEPLALQWLPKVPHYRLDERDFECIDRWVGPKWWEIKASNTAAYDDKSSLISRWFTKSDTSEGVCPSMTQLKFIVGLPKEAWINWVRPPAVRDSTGGASALTPFAGLMEWVLAGESRRSNADTSEYLGDALVDAGFPLTGATTDGPVARYIHTPKQWQSFLDQGGNPLISIHHHEEAKPLWVYLRDTHYGEMRSAIEKWALTQPHLQAAAEKEVLSRYFKGLDRFGKGTLVSAVRDHPEWTTLHDAFGRNPLMAVLAIRAGAPESFSAIETLAAPKKAKPLLHESDDQGRTMWYYLVQAGHPSSGNHAKGMMRLLVDEGVPPSLDKHGRGLLLQTLSPTPQLTTEKVSDPLGSSAFDVDWTSKRIKNVLGQSSVWLSGSDADQALMRERLLDRKMDRKNISNLTKNLHELGKVLTESSALSAEWLGAFVLNAFYDVNLGSRASDIERWQECGAVFTLSPEQMEKFNARVQDSGNEQLWGDVLEFNNVNWAVRNRAQDRSEALQKIPAAPARPRSRPRG